MVLDGYDRSFMADEKSMCSPETVADAAEARRSASPSYPGGDEPSPLELSLVTLRNLLVRPPKVFDAIAYNG